MVNFLITKLISMFSGLGEFFKLWRDMFDCLPLVCKLLIYFSFGGILLLCLLRSWSIGGDGLCSSRSS